MHVGDIVIEDDDIFGDGVNIAARLEGHRRARRRSAYPTTRTARCATSSTLRSRTWASGSSRTSPGRCESIGVRFGGAPAAAAAALPCRCPTSRPSPSCRSTTCRPKPGRTTLADGIVEAITAALSRIRSFFVIARNSAFTYKGRATNVRDIGKELGVAYLLEGSVQKGGNRLRITVQLIETETGAHVWSSRYDGTVDEIFDLQDRITEQVAGALQPSIRIAEIERSRRKRPQDLRSYDYTMRAMPHVWALEKEESAKALELLEHALAIDPEYPLALSLAGWCHAQRSVYNWVDDIPTPRRGRKRWPSARRG